MNTEVYAIYIIDSGHLPGIPARDLTKQEYEQHQALIEACPTKLYQVVEAPPKKLKKEVTDG